MDKINITYIVYQSSESLVFNFRLMRINSCLTSQLCYIVDLHFTPVSGSVGLWVKVSCQPSKLVEHFNFTLQWMNVYSVEHRDSAVHCAIHQSVLGYTLNRNTIILHLNLPSLQASRAQIHSLHSVLLLLLSRQRPRL